MAETLRYCFGEFTLDPGLGERERALTELERAFDDRSWLVTLLKVDPLYDELRSEPRFQALVGRLKFPA